MKKHDIGIIGLAVMGRNLALNLADHGYQVSGYNRSYEVTKAMMTLTPHKNVTPYETIEAFVSSLEKPRKIIMMIKAGDAVDQTIATLSRLLDIDDIIIDGGNSFFQDTIRRNKELEKKGIHYFGVGISGGEEGARKGPAIMPGGNRVAYEWIRPIVEDIAAKASDQEPCCTYIGENGAGHYVKMVHNGIEYADMQIISEAYLLMKYAANLTNEEMATIFEDFNNGELHSFLIHITSRILAEKDEDQTSDLIDKIKDTSAQKGTGKWTSMEAANLGVDASMIASAYNVRMLSSTKSREAITQAFSTKKEVNIIEKTTFIKMVKEGLYAAKMIAYAQGFDLLHHASETYEWNLDLANIAKIFRAGCIIQADFLNEIMHAYQQDPNLIHLLLDDFFKAKLMAYEESLRNLSIYAIQKGIPVPAFVNAISYFDVLKSKHVGANMIQAQRDFFGAHTFQRIDKEGAFHHEWGETHE